MIGFELVSLFSLLTIVVNELDSTTDLSFASVVLVDNDIVVDSSSSYCDRTKWKTKRDENDVCQYVRHFCCLVTLIQREKNEKNLPNEHHQIWTFEDIDDEKKNSMTYIHRYKTIKSSSYDRHEHGITSVPQCPYFMSLFIDIWSFYAKGDFADNDAFNPTLLNRFDQKKRNLKFSS